MFKGFYYILLLGLINLTACNPPKSESNPLKCHQSFSAAELQEDFNFLINNLSELHPDLHRVSSKEIIYSRVNNIQAELTDSLSYLEFLKLIAPLLTDVGCISTQWGHSKQYIDYRNKNTPLFPLKFTIQDEQFIIEENASQNKNILVGEEILEINGVSISDYLSKNYPLLPIDGNIKTLQWRWLESYFPNHHSNFWEQPNIFYLKIKDKNGIEREEKVNALLKQNINYTDTKKQLLAYNERDSIAILKVGTFNDNVLKRNQLNLQEFLDTSFKRIDSLNLNHLILDMRGNSWGNIDNGSALFSYLTEDSFQYVEGINSRSEAMNSMIINEFTQMRYPQPMNYNGKLYVVTDGWNVNAGGFFCSKIKNRPNTIITGEKPGNTSYGMNAMNKNIVLPHSKINLYIPTAQFIANKNELDNTEGISLTLSLDPPYIENTIKHIQQK